MTTFGFQSIYFFYVFTLPQTFAKAGCNEATVILNNKQQSIQHIEKSLMENRESERRMDLWYANFHGNTSSFYDSLGQAWGSLARDPEDSRLVAEWSLNAPIPIVRPRTW
jgi:hypothetical protein